MDENIVGIYVLEWPSGKFYIGQSHDVERRFITHKRNSKYVDTKIYYYWRKYGEPVMTLIEECSVCDLNNFEQGYLNMFRGSQELLNTAMDVVAPARGVVVSPETREKLRKKGTGRRHSPETRENISRITKGTRAGDNNPRAKLTWDDVFKIRSLYITSAYTQQQLSVMFSISQSVISGIILRQLWK